MTTAEQSPALLALPARREALLAREPGSPERPLWRVLGGVPPTLEADFAHAV